MNRLQFIPIQPFIGAEVEGIDLTKSITPETAEELLAGWRRHKVLVFRNQDITREQQLAFGRTFGVPERHPAFGEADIPEVIAIRGKPEKKMGEWHTDVTYQPAPPSAAILRCRTLPSVGGDTIFTNTAIAYERLPQDIKDRVEGLEAEHAPGFERLITDPDRLRQLVAANPPVTHPVVIVHPETGERALFVNEYFTTRIVGVSEEESKGILSLLFEEIKRPEYQMRVKWERDTVVIWDERVTQHYAIADYVEPRHLDRVTLSGTPPMSLHAVPPMSLQAV